MSWLKKYGVVVFVALTLAWLFRAPLAGRVWSFEDIEAYFVPLWSAAARALRHGVIPTWDLGAWSGQPLVADPQIGIFYPPNWLWTWMHPLRAYAWLALFHSLVAAAGMGALVRARGRSMEASALAALALGGSAFMVLELRHSMFGATTAWLPWVLWSLEKYSTTRRLDILAAGAGALGLAILAGGWSMLWWGAAVVGIYGLSRSARALVVVGLVGATLAMVQLLPAMAHARFSPRALGLEYSEATSYAWPSFSYVVTLFWPSWFGSTANGTYLGAPDQWELCGYAVGCITGLLALVSLGWRERRRERLTLFALVLFAVVVARGDGTPLHHFLFAHVPFYGAMRCPARALYVWTLIGPILGADGLDFLLSRSTVRRPIYATMIVCALALEILVVWRGDNPSTTLAAAEEKPPAATWVLRHAHPGRMVNDVHLGQRWHNFGLRYGFESAGGYNSLPVWRYLNYLYIANHGAPYPHAHIAQDLSAQGLWRLSSPLVDLLGVRWYLSSREHPPDGSGWTRTFAGPDGIDVWRNDESLPRGFVVYAARNYPDDDSQARAIADPTFRPAEVAIVDRPLPLPELTNLPSTPVSAFYRDSSTDFAVEVVTPRPGLLVLSEVWYPGWSVIVDGKPAELLRVDYALRGVLLGAGLHTVAMAIDNDALAYGAAISLTAIIFLFGLTGLARRRSRLAGARKPQVLA